MWFTSIRLVQFYSNFNYIFCYKANQNNKRQKEKETRNYSHKKDSSNSITPENIKEDLIGEMRDW
jgi:hypothetical protein